MPGHTHDLHHLHDLQHFPLMHALFGRRARRFGLGMEIPSGPLAFFMPMGDVSEQLLGILAIRKGG